MVKNFFSSIKKDWKKTLFWIVVGIFITLFLENAGAYLNETLSRKPNIEINFVTLQPTDIVSECKRFQDFILMYAGGDGYSQIFIVQNVNTTDNVIFNLRETSDCESCTFHVINFRNNGNLDANSIILDLTSSEGIQILTDNQKLVEKNCGGLFETKGCHFKIENLLVDEEIMISLKSIYPSNIKISCKVNGKEEYCKVRYANVFVQIVPENSSFTMNDKIVQIPQIISEEKINLFYFDQNSWTWIPLESKYEKAIEPIK